MKLATKPWFCAGCLDGPCSLRAQENLRPYDCPNGVGDAEWRQVLSPSRDVFLYFETSRAVDAWFWKQDFPEWFTILLSTLSEVKYNKMMWKICTTAAEKSDKYEYNFKEELERDQAMKSFTKRYTKEEIAEAAIRESFILGIMYGEYRKSAEARKVGTSETVCSEE